MRVVRGLVFGWASLAARHRVFAVSKRLLAVPVVGALLLIVQSVLRWQVQDLRGSLRGNLPSLNLLARLLLRRAWKVRVVVAGGGVSLKNKPGLRVI